MENFKKTQQKKCALHGALCPFLLHRMTEKKFGTNCAPASSRRNLTEQIFLSEGMKKVCPLNYLTPSHFSQIHTMSSALAIKENCLHKILCVHILQKGFVCGIAALS